MSDSMAQTPGNGGALIRLYTATISASSALAKALPGDSVVTANGRTYRVDRITSVSGERRIHLIDARGAVLAIPIVSGDQQISRAAVPVTRRRSKASTAGKAKSSKSKNKRKAEQKAREKARRSSIFKPRSVPDESEVSVSVRTVSGGLPGLGKRR
jgi:hypothetical protein